MGCVSLASCIQTLPTSLRCDANGNTKLLRTLVNDGTGPFSRAHKNVAMQADKHVVQTAGS